MSRSETQLFQLAAGYLNQDWDLDYASTMDAVAAFRIEQGPAASARLIEEIDDLLVAVDSDGELLRLWLNDFGGSIDPTGGSRPLRQWLEMAQQTLGIAQA